MSKPVYVLMQNDFPIALSSRVLSREQLGTPSHESGRFVEVENTREKIMESAMEGVETCPKCGSEQHESRVCLRRQLAAEKEKVKALGDALGAAKQHIEVLAFLRCGRDYSLLNRIEELLTTDEGGE